MKIALLTAVLTLLFVPAGQAQDKAFVPGEVVLFSEDFAKPDGAGLKRLRGVSARIGMAARGGRPFVHIRTPGRFDVPLPTKLPQKFTIEFDVAIPGENYVLVGPAGGPDFVEGSGQAYFSPSRLSYAAGGDDGKVLESDEFPGGEERERRVIRLAIAVDGPRAAMFVDGVQRIETDKPPFGRSAAVHFEFGGVDDPGLLDQNVPIWITNIRVATFAAR